MALPPDVAARIMASADRGFRIPVHKYTYASGPAAGEIFLYSPKMSDPDPERLVLRQINSEAENKVWVAEDPTQFKRCDDESPEDIFDTAHGVLLRDGWACKLNEDESAGSAMFKRGNRVWIERSLSPGQTMTKIPVVDLDTSLSFEVEVMDICFIAQLAKTDDEEDSLAVAVGPVVNYYAPKRKKMAQLFIVWPADDPASIEPTWESWIRGDKKTAPKKRFSEFRRLTQPEEQWQIFRLQWSKLNRRFVKQFREKKRRRRMRARVYPHVTSSAPESLIQAESSEGYMSDLTDISSTSGELGLHWEPGPIDKTNCCNLAPKCPLKPGEADLVASYVGGWQEIQHYHVQDADLDECPKGAGHQGGHCILRNDRTECVFSHDQIRHTCCKLRVNPLLPGVDAAPGDTRSLLWERPVSPDNFYDFADRVQPRLDADPKRDTTPETSQTLQRMARLEQELRLLAKRLSAPGRRWRSQHRPYKKRKYPEIAGQRDRDESSTSEKSSEHTESTSAAVSQGAIPVTLEQHASGQPVAGQPKGMQEAEAGPLIELQQHYPRQQRQQQHNRQQIPAVQDLPHLEKEQSIQLDQREASEQGSLLVHAAESPSESCYEEYLEWESLSGYDEDMEQDSFQEEEEEGEEEEEEEGDDDADEEARLDSVSSSGSEVDQEGSSLHQSQPDHEQEQQLYAYQQGLQQRHVDQEQSQHGRPYQQHYQEQHNSVGQEQNQQLPQAVALQIQHQQYQYQPQQLHEQFQRHAQFQQTSTQAQIQPLDLVLAQPGLHPQQSIPGFEIGGADPMPVAPMNLVDVGPGPGYGSMAADGSAWPYDGMAYGPFGIHVSPITFWNNLPAQVVLPDSATVPFAGAAAAMAPPGLYAHTELSRTDPAGLASSDGPLFIPGGLPWVPGLPDDEPR